MWLNAKRLRFVLIGLIALAFVVLAVSVYIASELLKSKSKNVQEAQLKAAVLEEEQNALRKAKSDVEKYKELSEIAASIVPRDKDQAQTVREINNLAASNNVKIGAITFPASQLGSKTGAKGANGMSDSQLKPVTGIAGTYSLNITVKSDGKAPAKWSDFINFLEGLEQNRRTALVTGVALTPDTKDPSKLQFILNIDEYIRP